MWKRRNVFPTMISSPSHKAWRCPGGNLLPRLMNVPFVDPRSSRKYWPLLRVIRAWRRDTFASGSSVSRSTSGKMPPSASQRPICASTSLNINCFPVERPFSITRRACGLAVVRKAEKLSPAETRPAANSGCVPGWGAWLPLPPFAGLWCMVFGRPFGLRGAPHSSQYCDPSRFSVLHLSQVIIVVQKAKHFTANAVAAPTHHIWATKKHKGQPSRCGSVWAFLRRKC